MGAQADFEAYWTHVVQTIGGSVDTANGLRLHAPFGGPPTNGILRWEGDLASEIAAWKTKGAPFSVTAHNDQQRKVCQEEGLVPRDPYHFIETPVRPTAEPAHPIRWNDVDAFIPIQMAAHDIPPEVEGMLAKGWQASVDGGDMELAVALDPEPAACAALFTGAGNAGMYAFGTLTSHRRRGLGTSLHSALMNRAHELGLKTACAVTTPDGLALAKAMGASPGPMIQQFLWFPS